MSSALLLQLTAAHVVKRDVKPLSLSPSLSLRDGLVATGKGLDAIRIALSFCLQLPVKRLEDWTLVNGMFRSLVATRALNVYRLLGFL